MKIIKGDTVVLRRGKEKGKRGVVKAVFPRQNVALVEGLNVVKRHTKQGASGAKSAGIYEKEAPIPLSALALVDPKTQPADPHRRQAYGRGPRAHRPAQRRDVAAFGEGTLIMAMTRLREKYEGQVRRR